MAEPRYVPRKVSAGVILVDRRGRVLLQLRDDNPSIMYPGHWGITGGAGKPDESPEAIARREILEETGLTLGRIEPFKAYYFAEQRGGAKRSSAGKADYELYLYHAPCDTPAVEMTCGEGQELRFFAPGDIDGMDIAYNHREVLDDFFGSPVYAAYLSGRMFEDTAIAEPLQHFRAAIEKGEPWFDALMQAIALWERPEEEIEQRRYRYLIGGEAFDWLLLAERVLREAPEDAVPDDETERLLFESRAPGDADERISDERLRDLMGDTKHRAHLNYVYGVIVEEALQYAVELDVAKEIRNIAIKDPRDDEHRRDPVFERIYGSSRAELLRAFREETNLAQSDAITLSELREFMYWLFKYRVKNSEPARVASDTRKAIAQLSSMEDAARRARRRRAARHEPREAFASVD